jgi:hypothetical protein
MYKYVPIVAALGCLTITPVLGGSNLNWNDIIADMKDLRKDFKDLRADQLQLQEALRAGNMTQVIKDAADIRADKQDIRSDIKDLKNDGIVLHKPKR